MIRPRYLTKSRYKVGRDCPTKLFYTGKQEYADRSQADPLLAALAEGGFQVGELARQYYPGGINVETLDYEDAEVMTADLMKRDQVIMYEPAFRYKGLFIRIDILVKTGDSLKLIEVKSKSFDSLEDQSLRTKAGGIKSAWQSDLHDVAFQQFVLANACPGFAIRSYLMMADKNAPSPTDRLNQKIRIRKDPANRKGIKISTSLSAEDLRARILVELPVDDLVRLIHEGIYQVCNRDVNYASLIELLAEHYQHDKKISPQIGSKCGKCEFRATPEDEAAGLKSGLKECWMEVLNWQDSDFREPSVLELWNSRNGDSYISSGKLKLRDLEQHDINIKSGSGPGLSPSQRQWLQVDKVKNADSAAYFDAAGISAEVGQWIYPLHHIDFETARAAIPFYKGRKPYEGILFQFSHHMVLADGTIKHAGQYLNAELGAFPNYDCVRELKKQLDHDRGTIFRYANHENTYLVEVYRQLMSEVDPPSDRDDLCDFIRSVTKLDNIVGSRCMVDMRELVKKYYYNPATNGSNSLKSILPAILSSSSYLRKKYSRPLYGARGGIESLNYSDWTWVRFNTEGEVIEPYNLLPPIFDNDTNLPEELFSDTGEIREGGAAMIAYCRLQFSAMSDYERENVMKALLKYCELDTLAMVMVYEAWSAWIDKK